MRWTIEHYQTERVLPFVFGGFPGFAIKPIYAQSNALFRTV